VDDGANPKIISVGVTTAEGGGGWQWSQRAVRREEENRSALGVLPGGAEGGGERAATSTLPICVLPAARKRRDWVWQPCVSRRCDGLPRKRAGGPKPARKKSPAQERGLFGGRRTPEEGSPSTSKGRRRRRTRWNAWEVILRPAPRKFQFDHDRVAEIAWLGGVGISCWCRLVFCEVGCSFWHRRWGGETVGVRLVAARGWIRTAGGWLYFLMHWPHRGSSGQARGRRGGESGVQSSQDRSEARGWRGRGMRCRPGVGRASGMGPGFRRDSDRGRCTCAARPSHFAGTARLG